MSHINLLPWRETLRKQRQQEFGVAAVAALIFAALVMLLVHMQVEAMIDHQNSRNRYLEQEIALMDQKIKQIEKLEKTKQQLLARMNIIQRLQQSRPLVVHLFDELVKTTPDGVVLSAIRQAGNLVTLNGVAESNTRVSAFMRNVESSEWIEAPGLDIISGGKGKKDAVRNAFTLQVAVKSDETEEAKNKGKKK